MRPNKDALTLLELLAPFAGLLGRQSTHFQGETGKVPRRLGTLVHDRRDQRHADADQGAVLFKRETLKHFALLALVELDEFLLLGS